MFAMSDDTTIRPFRIDISEADLDDPELCPAHFALRVRVRDERQAELDAGLRAPD